ncbi:hypothetical protein ACLESD_49565 [Pyxidicoccus sp. 3LFB2]
MAVDGLVPSRANSASCSSACRPSDSARFSSEDSTRESLSYASRQSAQVAAWARSQVKPSASSSPWKSARRACFAFVSAHAVMTRLAV